ncbi:MAG: hypothetical protein OXG65_16785 [Chloroflexi bacterium]|nr:hypothetical protein [Chloroflexota bacterium]
MTLHEAMVAVLRDKTREATPSEIAAWITDRNLFRRTDGMVAGGSQVSARAHKYPRLFYKNETKGDVWELREWLG